MKTESLNKKSKLRKVIKITGIVLACMVLIHMIAIFTARGINDVRLRLPDGVREKRYIELGGVEQYINIRGVNISKPIIIYLHGSGGGTNFMLPMQQRVESDYTFVYWSRRDGSHTYVKSGETELLLAYDLSDLDELVDYVQARFDQPIVLVGHSAGTRIVTLYAKAHPDKIAGYIGIGQLKDDELIDNIRCEISIIAKRAREAGNEQDALKIESIYDIWSDFLRDNPIVSAEPIKLNPEKEAKLSELEPVYCRYPPVEPTEKSYTIQALLSPDLNWNCFRWALADMGIKLGVDVDKYYQWVEQMGSNEPFPMLVPPDTLEVPVVIINGSEDYATFAELAQEYYDLLSAPKKEIFIIQGAGHGPMFEVEYMEEFYDILNKALQIVFE